MFNCLECSKNHKKHFDKYFTKRFANTYGFCNGDINKFCLMLREGVCSHENMDSWKRFDETLLPRIKDFYSNLNMEDSTDAYYMLKACKTFEIKNLGEYHGLYVQSDTLLLADVFENFRNKCIEICKLDPAHFYLNLD